MTVHTPKPSYLIYGLDDKPPLWDALVLAFQHFLILTPRLAYPAIIVQGFNGPPDLASAMVAMTMIAAGIGSFMQVNRRGPLGSGYLDPPGCGAAYIFPSIQAGLIGGPALIFGMTFFGGMAECIFSRFFYRLRSLFPPHVLGLVVTMVGLSLVKTAVTNFMGGPSALSNSSETFRAVITGLTTLMTTLGFSVWGKGNLKLYCLLFGIIAGELVGFFTGIGRFEDMSPILSMHLLAFPSLSHLGLAFDRSLAVMFLIASISTALKTSGEIITCQKMNDSDWQHPDMRPVARGLLSDGAYCALSGLLGGVGLSSSASNVGLSFATRSTSRRIAYFTGALLIGLAFLPSLPFLLTHMTKPVAGAALVFVASFMVVSGIQMMTLRMLDARKMYVIGISFIFGLSVDIAPALYSSVAIVFKPMFSSSLALASISAILMNFIFRLGVANKVEIVFGVDGNLPSSREIFDFMEANGTAWAARKDIIDRAASALTEVVETVIGLKLANGSVRVLATFDEFSLDLDISYSGKLMPFPKEEAPVPDFSMEDDDFAILSAQMVSRMVDRVKAACKGNECTISLHLDH